MIGKIMQYLAVFMYLLLSYKTCSDLDYCSLLNNVMHVLDIFSLT